MHKELWNVIKNLASNKEAINAQKLAFASHQLPAEVFETVKDHYQNSYEPDKKLPPWV